MEQVVAQWRRSGAFGLSLVMLHQVMPSVLLRCTAMDFEMAGNGGTFAHHRRFCHHP
jgi:hypothetical protein